MKTSVTQQDIDMLLHNASVETSTVFGNKCTLVLVKLENGFIISASSACVDPANYSEKIGRSECMKRIEDKLWELEGYALQKKLYEEAQHDNHH